MTAWLRSFSVRFVMIVAWILLILFFLCLPQFIAFIYTPMSRSINIFVWPMMIDAQKLVMFEKKTGIKVYVHYYESNEELLQKLRITGGKGYDLVMPADYIIDALRKENLIQKIDTSQLSFLPTLRPSLLNHYYDPDNLYCVPYFEGIYGLGIDTGYFNDKQPEPSLKLLFEYTGYTVAMTDVLRRSIAIASCYLYGDPDAVADPAKLAAVERLLMRQKRWVQMYTDIRSEDLLATGNCPVVMTLASDLWMIKRQYPELVFVLPSEGAFMVIDSFVLPKATKKQNLVYEFLNYLYQPDIIHYHATRYGFCPPIVGIDVDEYGIFCPTREQEATFRFFRNTVPESVINDLWISLMSR